MPRIESHGPLARYAKLFPYRELVVAPDITGYAAVVNVCTGYKIAIYSRARDARRQLRILGYTQEGAVWRIVAKKEQPVPAGWSAIEEGHEH